MNFLDLCRAVARESGTLAGGGQSITTTTTTSSGRADKIVNWVRDAWVSIQTEHDDWLWMRREFEHALTIGKARYTGADLGIDRLGLWLTADRNDWPLTLQDPDLTKADEAGIGYIDYSWWRNRYSRGLHDAARPTEFSVSPLRELVVGATPDKAYIMRGEYVLAPQVLAADADTPEMPDQYHKVIVWEALKLMSNADEATFALQSSVGEYARVRDAMTRDMRPRAFISFDADAVIA